MTINIELSNPTALSAADRQHLMAYLQARPDQVYVPKNLFLAYKDNSGKCEEIRLSHALYCYEKSQRKPRDNDNMNRWAVVDETISLGNGGNADSVRPILAWIKIDSDGSLKIRAENSQKKTKVFKIRKCIPIV